ncbi:MAG: hypothetical protein JWQ66_4642, partial [Mucilaginibacter sp.]|nr:hypothetical protein [Mucilaginibacter sp.]
MSAQALRKSSVSAFEEAFIAAIEQAVVRAPGAAIGLHEPHFGGNE